MEAYLLLARSNVGREVAGCDEQEEEIGCPSGSELSMSSSSSEELNDDASSSGSTGNFEMSSLMAQLPLKRGLSKFFDGKSQSFESLAAVSGLEDLAKPPRKRLRASRSCEVELQDAHRRRFTRPGCHNAGGAFKKVSRGRLSLLGAAPAPASKITLRPAATARPNGLPGQPLLFT